MKICGIYILRFKGTDKVYIGQSIDILRRYQIHLNSFKIGDCSIKLLEAYNIYGPPDMEILIEGGSSELDSLEKEAIEIFNSINNGFNSVEGGGAYPVLSGENNVRSKYLDEDIEYIFLFIVDNLDKSLHWVSEQTGVHRSTLKNINNGYSHKWLKDRYPEQYAILENSWGSRPINSLKYMGKPLPIAISPEGEEFIVEHITNFAKEHGLNRGAFGNMLRGNAKQHKGWYSGGFV